MRQEALHPASVFLERSDHSIILDFEKTILKIITADVVNSGRRELIFQLNCNKYTNNNGMTPTQLLRDTNLYLLTRCVEAKLYTHPSKFMNEIDFLHTFVLCSLNKHQLMLCLFAAARRDEKLCLCCMHEHREIYITLDAQ